MSEAPNERLTRLCGSQDDIDVRVFQRAGEHTIMIVEDIFLSAKFQIDTNGDDDPEPGADWVLEYLLEAMHGGDYTDDPAAHAAGEYEFLMTVEAIRIAADFLLHRNRGDAKKAAEHVARLRALAFPT